jgi:hypothetical protein
VQAGSGSVITCANVTTCVVECVDTCHVTCNDANPCEVHCLGAAPAKSCANGGLACGTC